MCDAVPPWISPPRPGVACPTMIDRASPARRRAVLVCAFSVVGALVCAGLLTVAVLAPAPPAALPFIVFVCIGAPIIASWELAPSVQVLRGPAGAAGALNELRESLDQLPETQHPLGL